MSVRLGKKAEILAAKYLRAQGLSIVTANYYCRRGEIDLVAREGRTVVFVEVRRRRNWRAAAESIDRHKRRKLIAAAENYLADYHTGCDCRFDAVLVADGEVRWLKNAFSA